jgi:hypothetical protein
MSMYEFVGGTGSPGAPPAPLAPEEDKRFGYRNIRYGQGGRDRELSGYRADHTWAHQRPFSILVCAMANHWKRGSWQRVMDMVQFTNESGFSCNLEEIMDRCMQPYDALGAMRNEGIMRARQGYEYLLYVDNDVEPTPDMLVRLLQRQRPIIAPYVQEPGSGRPLHGPHRQPYTGVQGVRWAVLSMLLFKTSVFAGFGTEFWNNAIGADEGYHFQKLWDHGHEPCLDTDQILPIQKPPIYPLASNRMPEEVARGLWDSRKEKLLEAPDRRPIDLDDPRQMGGEYLPFLKPEEAIR